MPTHHGGRGAAWMLLHDDGRELLIELMEGNGDSHRKLARVANYKSHSYIGRLLDPADPARTVTLEAGSRIAAYYGLKPHRFFVTEVSFGDGRKVLKKRPTGGRGVQRKRTTRPETQVA